MFVNMRECKRHVVEQPSGGFCTQCLQERLTLLWRGESFRSNGRDDVVQVAVSLSVGAPLQETSECSGQQEGGESTTVSVSHHGKRLAPNGSDDVIIAAAAPPALKSTTGSKQCQIVASDCAASRTPDVGAPDGSGDITEERAEAGEVPGDQELHPQKLPHTSIDIKALMEEWALLHANRRSQGLEETPIAADICEQSSVEAKLVVDPSVGTCDLRHRSHPLVDTIAKETALRVTEEVNKQSSVEGEDGMFGALEYFRDVDELYTHDVEEKDDAAACFSPARQGKLSKSNWVKVLVNPIISSSKVFPSKPREDVMAKVSRNKFIADFESRVAPPQTGHELKEEGKRKRELRTVHQSSEALQEPKQDAKYPQQAKSISNLETTLSRGVVEGIPDGIFQQDQTAMRMEASRNAVLLWLQDIPSPKTTLFQKTGQLQVPAPTDGSELKFSQTNGGMEVQSDAKFSTVDHSHEIVKESSQDTYSAGRIPFEMSSFQKFLVISTQKQMKNSTDSTTSRLVSEEYL